MIKRFTLSLLKPSQGIRFKFCVFQKTQSQQICLQKTENLSQSTQDSEQAGEKSKYEKEDRTTPGWIAYRILFWGSSALLSYSTYLVSQHNKPTPVEDQSGAIPGFIQAGKFLYQGYSQITELITKPPADKLLPDVVHPIVHPKTLVLNLSGTLLQADYVFGKGLIINKRPGLHQFLQRMSQIYEVVIFSDDDSMLINSLASTIDPRRNMITSYLGKECMILTHGHYIKDLKYLNRDLNKVIVIDKNKSTVERQQENVITLSEYKGDGNDSQLLQLSALLESLARPEVRDIRKTLKEMGQNPIQTYKSQIKEKQVRINKSKNGLLFGLFTQPKQK